MSHNIESMCYAGEKPWHNLGTKVPGLMKTEEALKLAHLDWDVSKEKMTVMNSNGMFEVPNAFAIMRSDNNAILGTVGNVYTPINNKEAFSFFDGVLGEGQGQIETAASLGAGEKVFMMAELPDVAEIVKDDIVKRYLLVHTSHDGSNSIEVLFTNVRVVCQNTLNQAIRNSKQKIKIKHTSNYEFRMKEAERTLMESTKNWEAFKEAAQHLAKTSITRVEVGSFVDAMFPVEENAKSKASQNRRDEFLNIMENGMGTDISGVKGSAWGLYNAYTEWNDHYRNVKGASNDSDAVGKRWVNTTMGNFSNDRQKAFDLIMNMAA